MEKNIDDFLNDISEAKESFEATPGFSLSMKDAEKMAERLAKIVEFENQVSDTTVLKAMIRDIQAYTEKSPVEAIEGDREVAKMEIPTALRNKMKAIESLLNKKAAKDLTDDEKEQVQDFAEKLADEFKKMQIEIPTDFKETGVNTFKIKFEQSFPIKLETGEATYYGLVRPPTGVITWQGPVARAKAREIGVPIKLPLMNNGTKKDPDFKVKRGSSEYGEFMSKFQKDETVDFDFDDSKEAKKKVINALEVAGVSFKTDNFEKRGALKGVEDAVNKMAISDIIDESFNYNEKELIINEGLTKNVKFWQNIAKIL